MLRIMVNSIQLTIADLVTECHDTHHPIDVWLYYEDQKEEAAKRGRSWSSINSSRNGPRI